MVWKRAIPHGSIRGANATDFKTEISVRISIIVFTVASFVGGYTFRYLRLEPVVLFLVCHLRSYIYA
jgi:hypothetical protein